MEGASEFGQLHLLTPPAAALSLKSRSILSAFELSYAQRQGSVDDATATGAEHHSIDAAALLCQLIAHGQHTRPARRREQDASALSCIYEHPQEGSVRDALSRCQGTGERWCAEQSSSSGGQLCACATSEDTWRGAAGDCLSNVALVRSVRSKRTATHSQMQQRGRCGVLQSGALESAVPAR